MGKRGPYRRTSLRERFMSKVNIPSGDPDACWEWRGALMRNGYGSIHLEGADGGTMYAHRCAWLLVYGQIDNGVIIRHRCDNKRCVRPTHLEAGTHADNMRDMAVRDRAHRSKRGLPRGVDVQGNHFHAYVDSDRRRTYLGSFTSVERASEAAELERRNRHGV